MQTVIDKKRNIFIDSSYRDRNIYPYSTDFEIPISFSGNKTNFDAIDPVCDTVPIYRNSVSFRSDIRDQIEIQGSVGNGFNNFPESVINSENPETLIIFSCLFPSRIRQEKDFYKGASLKALVNGKYEFRKIVGSEYLFPITYNVENPPDELNRDFCKIFISVPFSSQPEDGNDLGIYNSSYENVNLESYFFLPMGKEIVNYYTNLYFSVSNNPNFYLIGNYDENSKLFVQNKEIGYYGTIQTPNFDIFSVYKSKNPYLLIDIEYIGNNTYITNLQNTFIDDYYKNSFIALKNSTLFYKIKNYSFINNSITLFETIPGIDIIGSNETVEFYLFTRDNLTPLNYSVFDNKESKYQIELLFINIPNKLLKSDFGGFPINFQYLIVEISNQNTASNNSNILLSNNPNSTNATFTVLLSDNTVKQNSDFLHLSGNGQKQIITFQPSNSIRFKIKSPFGNILIYEESERYSPFNVNESIQVSFLLSINKI